VIQATPANLTIFFRAARVGVVVAEAKKFHSHYQVRMELDDSGGFEHGLLLIDQVNSLISQSSLFAYADSSNTPEFCSRWCASSCGGCGGITAFTSLRTNLSPFTKGCREWDASM
jgi:hypothetical protein